MLVQSHGVLQQKKPVAGAVEDSISLSITSMFFQANGDVMYGGSTVVTSSSNWTLTKIDTGDGTWWCYPSAIYGSTGATVYVSVTDSNSTARSCALQFACGTKTANCTINQLDF